MRTWCCGLVLWACRGEPDPRAEHLGDCSLAVVAELDGEPWYEEAILFSSFGDPLVSQTTYADGSVALAMSTYGEEPHQALSKAVDRPDEGQAGGWDERWDYTWRKGDLVERRYALGDDGALDEVVTLEWEQHRVQRQETRLDPNGPPDQVVTYD